MKRMKEINNEQLTTGRMEAGFLITWSPDYPFPSLFSFLSLLHCFQYFQYFIVSIRLSVLQWVGYLQLAGQE